MDVSSTRDKKLIDKINLALMLIILWGCSTYGMALDLDNLETLVESQACQMSHCITDCDWVLTAHNRNSYLAMQICVIKKYKTNF